GRDGVVAVGAELRDLVGGLAHVPALGAQVGHRAAEPVGELAGVAGLPLARRRAGERIRQAGHLPAPRAGGDLRVLIRAEVALARAVGAAHHRHGARIVAVGRGARVGAAAGAAGRGDPAHAARAAEARAAGPARAAARAAEPA